MLDVQRNTRLVFLDIRLQVEVGLPGDQAAFTRVVGEALPDWVGNGEDPSSTGSKHSSDLAHHLGRVSDEGHGAERRAGQVQCSGRKPK